LTAVAVGLLGCGGDDGESSGLSQEELDKQSAAICRDGSRQVDSLSVPNLEDPAQAAAWLTDVIAIFDRTVVKLRALEPEEDLKADYDAYVALLDENGDVLKDILAKAEARDPTGKQDFVEFLNDDERDKDTKAAARKAGLTGCANA
jgi:hypothetical protein